jgi:hypothetical protein
VRPGIPYVNPVPQLMVTRSIASDIEQSVRFCIVPHVFSPVMRGGGGGVTSRGLEWCRPQ